MKTKILSVLYFLVGITYMVLQYNPVSLPETVVKALIIPLLITILWVNHRQESTRMYWLMFIALLFSWAGDVALEFTGRHELMFVAGLVCFLLTHVLYFTVFSITPGRNLSQKKLMYYALPVLIYGAVLLFYLYHDLGEMRMPVIVYTVVILAMLIAAINRIEKVSRISYYLVLFGAILFVLSDSLIAINKFSHPFQGSSIVIMSTYIAGQFLIVMGYMKQHREDFA